MLDITCGLVCSDLGGYCVVVLCCVWCVVLWFGCGALFVGYCAWVGCLLSCYLVLSVLIVWFGYFVAMRICCLG